MEEGDARCAVAPSEQIIGRATDRVRIDPLQHASRGVESLVDLDDHIGVRTGLSHVEREEVAASLVADVEQIVEAACDEQGDGFDRSLEQGVRAARGCESDIGGGERTGSWSSCDEARGEHGCRLTGGDLRRGGIVDPNRRTIEKNE